MTKFEEFTISFGNTVLLNTDHILSAREHITTDFNTSIILITGTEYRVKESYIEVFERLQ
jgi:uncharacterized protein YlzI (FlbEa/FlbD family)